MTLLLKTTNKQIALAVEKVMIAKYGDLAIYWFQYNANNGKFYYEVLLNDNWVGFTDWHDEIKKG